MSSYNFTLKTDFISLQYVYYIVVYYFIYHQHLPPLTKMLIYLKVQCPKLVSAIQIHVIGKLTNRLERLSLTDTEKTNAAGALKTV